ncbi:TraG family conjugative transposon ATPase [Sphingobacterium bovistauri]|uniref:TraG family conjugative transposon ATPase n=1 Tax=Sphingobacterium bovistauri TaxID=2781959 RepID=A0ABS7Z3P5_9SPHI|nr:TraG family conjugative transposon ATPase [Sphingobacterium bovistauri]MCA5004046.1 TraG family conjugative transposon ATPase [Sphingobacterium bovistauri]
MKTTSKSLFEIPYVGIDNYQGIDILYNQNGDYSVILKISNPVMQYAADTDLYIQYQQILLNIVKILGEGHILQKQDIFIRKEFKSSQKKEFLQQKYQEHFADRPYTEIQTYLTISRIVKKGSLYTYDSRQLATFIVNIHKILDLLFQANLQPIMLKKAEIDQYVKRVMAMNFRDEHITLDNIRPQSTELNLGSRALRAITLINTESIDLPEMVSPCTIRNNSSAQNFPIDNFFFLYNVPDYQLIIYNQLIEIPPQRQLVNKLEVKRNRHASIPDPANTLCVEDINRLLVDVARENQLLVHAHFCILVASDSANIDKPTNYIEAALFQQGIIASRNAFNQLELFRASLPANAVELKKYDWFLTTCDAALCLFFKERLLIDEPSDFLLYFTDRQGVPVAIDPSDFPMQTGRIKNRNRFVLGSSGTGKSYAINAIVQQYLQYNMDVVIVDVGHSYSGLCSTYNGKYITFMEDKPITMNPFAITREEFNIEKKDFLITLICLLWKGSDGQTTALERDVIAKVISDYFISYFSNKHMTSSTELNFNSFYSFAKSNIPNIMKEENIPFDVDEFCFVLKKFYKGGEYEQILNEPADKSLFDEQFVVYEIDNIQSNKILLPIVTLIIMDMFIQKMRHRKNRRKTLILEEAWRAISSPIMANFLLYLNKTVRKFYGEIIEVTQEINDIIGNPIIKDSIINNSDTVILLQQKEADLKKVAELLNLSPVEQLKISTINTLDNKQNRSRFNEFYIKRGNTGEVYGVEVSLFHHMAFTTEKPEKSAVEIYVRHFKTYPQALSSLVEDFNSSGMSLNDFVSKVNLTNSPYSI